jgi:hypothetical protein
MVGQVRRQLARLERVRQQPRQMQMAEQVGRLVMVGYWLAAEQVAVVAHQQGLVALLAVVVLAERILQQVARVVRDFYLEMLARLAQRAVE